MLDTGSDRVGLWLLAAAWALALVVAPAASAARQWTGCERLLALAAGLA